MNRNPKVTPSDERLVELNRDHHRRMSADTSARNPAHATAVTTQDNGSRTAILEAMRGAASRFGAIPAGGRVLELGAGRGGDRETLEVTLDADYTGIEVVPEIAALSGVFCCSIETLPEVWGSTFRWVYSRHVMEHVLDINAAIARLAHVLAPDGVCGAVTPHYFPDPEPAHVSQLHLGEWAVVYRAHGLIPVYAVEARYNCPEAHIVVVHREMLEKCREATTDPTEREAITVLLDA